MDNSANKKISVQFSPEEIDKLRNLFSQLNINIAQNPSDTIIKPQLDAAQVSSINKSTEQYIHNTNNADLNGLDLDDGDLDENQNDTTSSNTINDVTNQDEDDLESLMSDDDNRNSDSENDSSEITPDDIITSDDKINAEKQHEPKQTDDEMDLFSDDDEKDQVVNTSSCVTEARFIPGGVNTSGVDNGVINLLQDNRRCVFGDKVNNSLKEIKQTTKESNISHPIDQHYINYINDCAKPPVKKECTVIPAQTLKEHIYGSHGDKVDIPTKMEIIKTENKITLNVGGKKFNLKKSLLGNFGIYYSKLQKIVRDDGRTYYFLDRDPYYFSKIVDLVKIHGFNKEKISAYIENYSEQLISELCAYCLLDKKFAPSPKLKLKRIVAFPSRHDDIIKIVVDDQLFETTSGVLSRSNYFDTKLKMSRSKQFFLLDVDPKVFRYVINFLRTGELYVNNDDIVNFLNNYGIEYDRIESKKISSDIISHYIPNSLDSVENQLNASINFFNPKNYPIGNSFHPFIDNKYYYPQNMAISLASENINIITTNSQLKFDSDIIFNLTDQTKNLGDSIEDLVLCIDIPILKPTENMEYVNMVEYQIINNISVISSYNSVNKLMMQTNRDIIYLNPVIYTNNPGEYHELTKIGSNKMKILYENNLIDVHRITLPLFLFKEKQNHLPVKKIISKGGQIYLVVKLAPLTNIIKNYAKDEYLHNLPLLNICLIGNFINFPNAMPVLGNNNNIISIPINTELKNKPILYLYDKIHSPITPIDPSANQIYDIVVLPLDKFGYIKDFYFVIVEKDDFINNRIDKFTDGLIELEILRITNDQKKTLPGDKSPIVLGQVDNSVIYTGASVYCKLDSIMLNQYIPLKKLGHRLPTGIYYYSFSSDPKENKMLGGLYGPGYVLRIKIKKMLGVVKFFVTEYLQEII